MLSFTDEMEALLDSFPISIVIQDFVENRVIINNEARKLLSVDGFELTTFRRTIISMKQGVTEMSIGERELSIKCVIITLRDRAVKMCMLTDISEQISTYERGQIYKACLDAITDMNLFACDAKGNIILYNQASSRSDNVNTEGVVGQNMYELFGPDSDTAIRRALSTGEPVLDWESAYNAAGRVVRNVGSAYPIKSKDKLIGAFSINRSYEGIRALLVRTIDLQKQLISASNSKSNGTSYDFDSIIGKSEAIKNAKALAYRATNSTASVIIYGETGSGKELFAQSIHNASICREKPFVAINCAAIPETLLESTLFGTVKGAFTGADNMAGLFEQAGEGTLLLDECNSLPMNLQAKLLRVLQERVFRRIGGKKDIEVRCRIISTCNCSPLECVESNTLRRDLYYRLAVVCIEVPPLRERHGDVALLTDYFLAGFAHVYGMSQIKVSDTLQELLSDYSWPGNVRELRHVLEGALLLLNPGEPLQLCHFPEIFAKELRKGHAVPCEELSPPQVKSVPALPCDLKTELREYERSVITEALKKCGGNISQAARLIGYNRTTLQYQMEKLSVNNEA